MHSKKLLTTLVIGLSLLGSIAGASAAHAGSGLVAGPVPPIGTQPVQFPALSPHITTHVEHCRYIITGSFFTPHGQVKLVARRPDEGLEVDAFYSANASGELHTFIYIDPSESVHVKVYAVDMTKHETSNTIGETLTCAA